MSKKLRQITNLCSAALMLSPVFVGTLQQSAPIVASAKRRHHSYSHRSYSAPRRHRSYSHRSYSAPRRKSSHRQMRLSGYSGKKRNSGKRDVLKNRIKKNLAQTSRRKGHKKGHKKSNNYDGLLSTNWNPDNLQPINWLNPSKKTAKALGIKTNKKTRKKMARYAKAAKKYGRKHSRKRKHVKVDFKKLGRKSRAKRNKRSNKKSKKEKANEAYDLKLSKLMSYYRTRQAPYIDTSEYNSIVNDPQLNNATKASLLALNADEVMQTNSDTSIGAFNPSAANQPGYVGATAAPVGETAPVNSDAVYYNDSGEFDANTGQSITSDGIEDPTSSADEQTYAPASSAQSFQLGGYGDPYTDYMKAAGSLYNSWYKNGKSGSLDYGRILSDADADGFGDEVDESAGESRDDNSSLAVAKKAGAALNLMISSVSAGMPSASAAEQTASLSASESESTSFEQSYDAAHPSTASSSSQPLTLSQQSEQFSSAMANAASQGFQAMSAQSAGTYESYLDSQAKSDLGSGMQAGDGISQSFANSENSNFYNRLKSAHSTENQFNIKEAKSAEGADEDQQNDDVQQEPRALGQDMDSAAEEFTNAVQTAPLSSSAKTSLKAQFGNDPQSAAASFVSAVSGKSGDGAFKSAMSSMTVPGSGAASYDYSANPSKAASDASSALSGEGKGLTSSEKADANNLNFTNDPLTADQSKQLTEDQQALAGVIKGANAGNHTDTDGLDKVQGNIQNASSTLEQTPEMLNGTTPLMDKPENGNVVMDAQDIQANNQKPDYSNTFMIYQQARLNNGTLMDHVVSYDSKVNGWIPDNGIQASAQPNVIAAPKGTYHFSNPSKDATYELPLGTSWSDPFVVNRADAVGADNLKVTAARTAKKNGKTITSYYVQDADHPYINGWVNKDELSQDVAKGASSKQANTPKSTDSKITKFALNVEGNLTEAPVQVDADKAGTDSLTLPSYFSNDQAKALSGKRGTDIDWGNLNDNFFGKDKDMNKFYGSTTYYEQNGHIIYVPASDIKEEENSGKQLFHFVYKVDKTATRRANKHAKNGDILNIYYRRVQVSGPATNKAKTPKNDSKVTTTQSNQKPSNDAANQKVSTPNK